MRSHRYLNRHVGGLACAVALFLQPASASADTITKANNTVALNLTNSWVGEVVPTNTHVAVWDNTVTGANVANLGGNQSWLGLTILNPGGAVTISNSPAATLTLGTNGVDMAWATADLTLFCNVSLGASQTWDVGTGRTNTVAGVISGTGANTLFKAGAGTLRLLNANSHSGPTIIADGTLALEGSGSLSSSSIIDVRSGTTFDVSGKTGSNYTFTSANILTNSMGSGIATINARGGTLTLASGARAGFTVVGGGSPSMGKISVTGNLTFNNNTFTVNVTGAPLVAGTYRLMGCTGTLSGSPFVAPAISGLGLGAGTDAYLRVTSGTAGHVDLVVGPFRLKSASNSYLLNSTNSWINNVVPGSSDVAIWTSIVSGNSVFTNYQSWGGIKILNLAPSFTISSAGSQLATLNLGSNGVDMSEATKDFLFRDCGINLGASQTWNVAGGRSITVIGLLDGSASSLLTKEGAGTLILTGVLVSPRPYGLTYYNAFAGDLIINGGTVSAAWGPNSGYIINTNSALGAVNTNRTITVNNGGILSFDKGNIFAGGSTPNATPSPLIVVNQGGTLRTRATVNTSAGSNPDGNNFGRITLHGGSFDLGSGYSPNYGAAILTDTITVGGSVASIILATGTTNSFANLGHRYSTNGIIFDVADATGNPDADLIVSALLQNAAGTFTVPTNDFTSLTKTGSGTMALAATNRYTGATVVSAGTLALTGKGSITNSSNIIVSNGATLDVSGVTNPPYRLVSGQTLKGNGTIRGELVLAGGATLSPGVSIGALTFTTNLTLNGNTLIEVNKDGGTNDFITVGGTLTYGGTLIATNVGGDLQFEDSFVIATAATVTGNFTNVIGSPGEGRAWSFNPATSTLSVIGGPATLHARLSDNALTFSWWGAAKLQAQTNNAGAGISMEPADWYDYPGATNSPFTLPIDPANGSMFFRLINQ